MRLHARTLPLILFAVSACLLISCDGGKPQAPPPAPSAPAPAPPPPAPPPPPGVVTQIDVPITDPSNGTTTTHSIEVDEGAGAGDDPTKEGDRGKTLMRVGGESAIVLPFDELGDLDPSIGLDAVTCGRDYLISRYIDAPTGVAGCAPPAAMAAQFQRTKDDAMARAIEVVKECWKHPSCQARILFVGSMRYCYMSPDGTWYLYTCYEVRVTCFTL